MGLADHTSLHVVLINGSYRLRYRLERCGQSEWIATVDDVSNGRNRTGYGCPPLTRHV